MAEETVQDTEEYTDLGLVAPLCHITTPINQVLLKLLILLSRHWLAALLVCALFYVASLLWVHSPGVVVSYYARGLIICAPFLVFLVGAGSYVGVTIFLLTLFARDPGVRVTVAGFLLVLLYGTTLSLSMHDTWLFLKLGSWGLTAFIVVYLVGMTVLLLYFAQGLMRHYRLTGPVMILLGALIWFEGESGFSTTTINLEDVASMDCYGKRVPATRSSPSSNISVCNMSVVVEGQEITLDELYFPRTKVRYLEIRHALFDHYSLR